MNVIVNCKDKIMVDKCLKRLIEYFIRPSIGKSLKLSQEKLNAWGVCVKQISNLKQKKYRGYDLFFEEVMGRNQSLTILETQMTHLLVMNKLTKEKKTIILPRNTSLWKLRQVIDENFDLKRTNF